MQTQLTLGQLIAALELQKPDMPCCFAWSGSFIVPQDISCYRCVNGDLAINPDFVGLIEQAPTVQDVLTMLRERTLNKSFAGWKGGNFCMGNDTLVWVAQKGCSGEPIVGVRLRRDEDIFEDYVALETKF